MLLVSTLRCIIVAINAKTQAIPSRTLAGGLVTSGHSVDRRSRAGRLFLCGKSPDVQASPTTLLIDTFLIEKDLPAAVAAQTKNRALDVLRRERTAPTIAPQLGRLLESEWTLAPTVEELFGAHAIKDDQLHMMFSCCHPRLPAEAQVALVLHILCGFTENEVASAFASGHAAIEKRISRASRFSRSSYFARPQPGRAARGNYGSRC